MHGNRNPNKLTFDCGNYQLNLPESANNDKIILEPGNFYMEIA